MATRMQQRRGTAAQWISTNSGNGPILNAGEIGWESDTNKFKIGDGTNTWLALDYFSDTNSTVNPAFGSSITFEGATANNFETTIQVTDPTVDRTITLPDESGTVALTGTNVSFNNITATGDLSVTGDLTVSGTTTSINTSTLEVEDKNILIAKVDTSTISATGAIASSTGTDPYTVTITGLTSTTGVVAGMNITATNGTGGFGSTPTSITVASISSGTSLVATQTGGTSPNVGTITSIIVSGSDITADGAGLTVQGTTNKTFNWVNSTNAFTSSENIAVPNGKSFYGNLVGNITGTVVADANTLSGTTLNSTVITSSLTALGTVTTGTWSATAIALDKGGTGATTQAGAANAVLPSQTGHADKILKTDGTNVSFTSTPSFTGLTVSTNDLDVGSQSDGLRTTDGYTNPMAVFSIDADNDYAQLAVKNTGNGTNSSTDVIAYSDNGDDTSGWIDMGITSSAFTDAEFTITGKNDGYVFLEAPIGNLKSINNKALTSNVATLTTSAAHGYSVSDEVVITEVDSTFNGTYTIASVPTSTTFTYAKTAANVTSVAVSPVGVAKVATGDGNLVLATGGNGTRNKIIFAAGGLSTDNAQMEITPDVNVHIEIQTPSTSSTTGALTIVGGVGIQGDLNIDGNVAIEGTITFGGAGTTVETANLNVTDPAIFVGTNNQADIVDLAFIGEYATTISTITKTVSNKALTSNVATLTTSTAHTYLAGDVVVVSSVDATFNGTFNIIEIPTSTTFTYAKTATNVSSAAASGSAAVSARRKFAGIARDASDGVVKAFKDATTKPTSTVNFAEAGLGYSDLQVGAITATSASIGDVSNTELQYLNGVTSSVQTQLNAKAPLASPTFTGTVTVPATITAPSSVVLTLPTSTGTLVTATDVSSIYAPLLQTTSVPTFTSNNYTLIAGDKDKVLLATNSTTAGTVTIPSGVFATGTVITIVQTGTGQLTLTASGTTINSNDAKLKLNGQYASCQLICTASNTFLAIGNLAA